MRLINQDWRSSKQLSYLNMRMMGKCLRIVLIGCVAFTFQFENLDVDHNNFFFWQCLICLDDYQPEENIRVMSCRHAFHQTCVDEWLQTGRNNCPACRTTVRPRKYLFYNAYLAHDCFLSHLGRDGWHKQLHILISYIKNTSLFSSFCLVNQKKCFLPAYWPCLPKLPFF